MVGEVVGGLQRCTGASDRDGRGRHVACCIIRASRLSGNLRYRIFRCSRPELRLKLRLKLWLKLWL